MNVPGRDIANADILQLVQNWMRDRKKGNWFLILDNVDDAGFLLEHLDIQSNGKSGGRPLIEYIPHCSHGSMLITSRNKNAALQIVEQQDIIAVNPMDETDAQSLLQRKLEQQPANEGCSQDIVSLAAALEYMPLAIVQAAAFIFHRAPRCSVRDYLEHFQNSDQDRTGLLDYEAGQLRRDREAKNSIFVTWQLTFDHVRQSRPSAADLLSLMSFFDRQGIPEALLRGREDARAIRNCGSLDQKRNKGLRDQERYQLIDNDEFEKDVLVLRNYSFISVNTDRVTFEMHRLVQLATQTWLQSHNHIGNPQQQFVTNLNAAFPDGKYENWGTCQILFPHAQKAAQHEPGNDKALNDWADLLYWAARYAKNTGKLAEAERMSIQSMNVRTRLLGKENRDTLSSMRLVASCYTERGHFGAAEALLKQVIEACKKHFLSEENIMNAMDSLASLYQQTDRLQEAEQVQLEMIDKMKDLAGCDHPKTLISMANLAITYWKQGRVQESERLDKEVLEMRKRKLGLNHPDTLDSMNNLATTWKHMGYHAEAIELMRECVKRSKHVLGEDHPDYIKSLGALTRWQVEDLAQEPLDLPDSSSRQSGILSLVEAPGAWQTEKVDQVQSGFPGSSS